jgi:hypothetical protein
MLVLLAALGALLSSCASLNAPVHAPAFPQNEMSRTSREGIEIGVWPIVAEDEYWRLFDENLPSMGIVALWVEIRNTRAAEIGLDLNGCMLRVGGRGYAALGIGQVFEHYYNSYHVRMYAMESDRTARLKMERVAFQPGRMPPAAKREGLLFFRVDPSQASGWGTQASLLRLNIRLSVRAKTTLEIVLTHVHS